MLNSVNVPLYKLYYFSRSGKYIPINGLWHSVEEFFYFLECSNNDIHKLFAIFFRKRSFIKIPFFGYYSPQFTGFDLRALAGTRRPEI